MLGKWKQIIKTADIRKRLVYVMLMVILIRLGSHLPIPGVDHDFIRNWFANQNAGGLDFLNVFTGGSFERMSVFALGITPYITSSIIIQLLTIAVPKLGELQKDGEDGRKKMTAITRYLTVGLAAVESIGLMIGFGRQGLVPDLNILSGMIGITCLIAGSASLMLIGERLTEHGIGNGISIVLTVNILSRLPSDFSNLFENFVKGKSIAMGSFSAMLILLVITATILLIIVLNGAQRKIIVRYSKKIKGSNMAGGQDTHIPLKMNTAGVIPVIFASSILSTPAIIASFFGKANGTGVGAQVLQALNQQNWFHPKIPGYTLGYLVYALLIIYFAYFYTSITFNPLEVADNIRKQGGSIPGVRSGKPTADYLKGILETTIFMGAIGILIVATVPIFFSGVFGATVSFGGTSLIIIVSVVLETMKQMESMAVVRNYKGFMSA